MSSFVNIVGFNGKDHSKGFLVGNDVAPWDMNAHDSYGARMGQPEGLIVRDGVTTEHASLHAAAL